MNRILISAFVVVSSTFFTLPAAFAAGEVYRWVDDQGVVHYGDRLPEGVQGASVNIRPNTVQTVGAKPRQAAAADGEAPAGAPEVPEKSFAQQQRDERDERRREYAKEAQRMETQCAIMRQQKASLEPNPRVLVQDENGEVRRLDDNERMEGLEEANDFLSKNCN